MACYMASLLVAPEPCFSFWGGCQAKLGSVASGQQEVMGEEGEGREEEGTQREMIGSGWRDGKVAERRDR